MAVDKSPPHFVPIAVTTIVCVVVLIGLKPIFDTYYVEMFDAELYRKVGSVQPTELLALHAAEKKSFAAAPVPLDKAMEMVAHDRAIPLIAPEQSTDTAALVGWAQLPKTGLGSLPPLPAPSASAAPASSGSAAPTPSTAPSGSAQVPAMAPSSSSAAMPPHVPAPPPAQSAATAPKAPASAAPAASARAPAPAAH